MSMRSVESIWQCMCELFHCNSFYLKERKVRVVHNAHVAYIYLASIPGREEKGGLVYFVCACAK